MVHTKCNEGQANIIRACINEERSPNMVENKMEDKVATNEEDNTDTISTSPTPALSSLQDVAFENWRGQGIPKISKKRPTYFQPDPTILYVEDSSKGKRAQLGVLKNGNLCNLRGIKIENKWYTVSYTHLTLPTIYSV